MQRDKIHTKERWRRVERREKVGRRVVLEGRWDRWLYDYIMVRGLLLWGGFFFFEGAKRRAKWDIGTGADLGKVSHV